MFALQSNRAAPCLKVGIRGEYQVAIYGDNVEKTAARIMCGKLSTAGCRGLSPVPPPQQTMRGPFLTALFFLSGVLPVPSILDLIGWGSQFVESCRHISRDVCRKAPSQMVGAPWNIRFQRHHDMMSYGHIYVQRKLVPDMFVLAFDGSRPC